MSKVICNSIGTTMHCFTCGASKPHYPQSCEPCPVNNQAVCKTIVEPEAGLQPTTAPVIIQTHYGLPNNQSNYENS